MLSSYGHFAAGFAEESFSLSLCIVVSGTFNDRGRYVGALL